MPKPRWLAPSLLLAQAALGCAPRVATIAAVASPVPASGVFLAGTLHAPLAVITQDGGGVISNNGGSVISNNGGSLISQTKDGPALISQTKDGPALVSQTKDYGLLAVQVPDGRLRQAFLVLMDRDERFYRDPASGEVFTATTDAAGGFGFPVTPGFPLGKDVVVTARLAGNGRLEGFLAPGAGGDVLRIDVASTLCTELLRDAARRAGRPMSAYDRAGLADLVTATQQAIEAGDLPAVATRPGPDGQPQSVLTFDLDAQHADALRNQYVIRLSAVAPGNAPIRALSDAWTRLVGERPLAVTTELDGPGAQLLAAAAGPPAGPVAGGAIGTTRQVFFNDVAAARSGDVFVANADPAGSGLANLFRLRPDGQVVLVAVPAATPPSLRPAFASGLAVEREPADGGGSLLVATGFNGLLRVPLTPGGAVERVAGLGSATAARVAAPGGTPAPAGEPADPADPAVVDGPGAVAPVSNDAARTSGWRLEDEGERRYRSGAPVPGPARFAHLAGPRAVAVDELGNVYLADGQRIRMIPKADGSYYGYRQPQDADRDGVVDGFGEPLPMKAGCIYTIAGNPAWDPARAGGGTDPWQGGFGGDGGPAQAAQLRDPGALGCSQGYLYVADTGNGRIRRIARDSGRIETLAAGLALPNGLALDGRGHLFLADEQGGTIRVLDLAGGQPRAIAGRGPTPAAQTTADPQAHPGDGEARHWADLAPTRLALDAQGNLRFLEARTGRLRTLWRPFGGDE